MVLNGSLRKCRRGTDIPARAGTYAPYRHIAGLCKGSSRFRSW